MEMLAVDCYVGQLRCASKMLTVKMYKIRARKKCRESIFWRHQQKVINHNLKVSQALSQRPSCRLHSPISMSFAYDRPRYRRKSTWKSKYFVSPKFEHSRFEIFHLVPTLASISLNFVGIAIQQVFMPPQVQCDQIGRFWTFLQ